MGRRPGSLAAAAASDAEWAKGSEGVGAVYDQDEQYDEFCACVTCITDHEEEVDVSDVSTSEFVSGDFVCGVDGLSDSDDDLVTAEYRGLRDVDGWQRRDPWGGCADDVPKRASISITPTFISTPTSLSSVSFTLIYILRVVLVRQRLHH